MFWINCSLLSSRLNQISDQFTITVTHIIAEGATGAGNQKLNFVIIVVLSVQYLTHHLLIKAGQSPDSSQQL
jgi:hypothetical protein